VHPAEIYHGFKFLCVICGNFHFLASILRGTINDLMQGSCGDDNSSQLIFPNEVNIHSHILTDRERGEEKQTSLRTAKTCS